MNKNVLSCLLKDGKEVNAVMLGGRLFHARATVTRNDRSPIGAEPSTMGARMHGQGGTCLPLGNVVKYFVH